jgi:hypothetical protein
MRDTTIHGYLTNIVKYVQQVENSAKLGITGEAVRNAALQELLIKKGLITEQELTESIGNIIRKANEPQKQEEAPKGPEIVPATPEQVADVQKSVEESKPNA